MKTIPEKVRLLVMSLLFLGVTNTLSAKEIELTSPDKHIRVNVKVGDNISYDVSYDSDLLMQDCVLALDVNGTVLGKSPKLTGNKRGVINETIDREVPTKNAQIKNHCNTLLLNFKGGYSVEFRAFNDGIAYRFITNRKDISEIKGETVDLNFAGNYLTHISKTPSFKTSYEYPYSHVKLNEWKADDQMSYLPILLQTDKGYSILVSEADLFDYPCLFFKGTGSNGIVSTFPKFPLEFGEDGDRSVSILKEADYVAKTSGKRNYPWRMFVIGKNDADIVSNEMVYKLSRPCTLSDLSWIKPGQVSWEWWNGASPYHVDFKYGCNLETYKYFIDFASEFGIPYIIMDEGWAKSTRDPYTPNPNVNLPELIRYGKEKNVGIVLWLTWLTVENNFDLFKTFSDWGIAGVKIDFMDRSDQWMVNYYERVAKEAAKHKLFVDFHGSFKPAGMERAYPNILSYEGVRGMEQMGGATPENNIYLPFMRNAVGAMDYTPGAMISMQPEVYCSRRPNSAAIGTRAYQMALFVVFESGLQMLADNPTNYYRERECTEYITSVPVTWDETRVLQATIGESLVVAKRKGDKWYIGGITNDKGRDINISLDFLKDGRKYKLTSFEDGINADRQALDYKKKEQPVNKSTTLTLHMVRNGGWAGVIE